jgi:hypothetical protein
MGNGSQVVRPPAEPPQDTTHYSGRAGHVDPLETATPASPVRWDDCELVACAVCKQRMQRRSHLSGDCKGANAVQ